MHLVPIERAGRRVIDDERVCIAIDAIGDPDTISSFARQFAVLGDPSRLTLLLAIHHAGPISVSDLAVAADMNDTTVSQALRLLKAAGTVASERDGRVVRYRLASKPIAELLDRVNPLPPKAARGHRVAT